MKATEAQMDNKSPMPGSKNASGQPGTSMARAKQRRWLPTRGSAGPDNRRKARRAIISVVVVFAAWELAVLWIDPPATVIVGPVGIAEEFLAQAEGGDLWLHTRTSLVQFIVGFAIASIGGVGLGMLSGTSKAVEEFTDPWVTALYATPLIAIAPIFIIWFGIGDTSSFAIVALVAFFPVAINTTAGVHAVSGDFRDVGRVFRANRLETFTKILFPGSLPFILSGLRLAVGRGLVGVVVADLFASQAGLGWLILTAAQTARPARIFVGAIVLALLGVIMTAAIRLLGQILIPKEAGYG